MQTHRRERLAHFHFLPLIVPCSMGGRNYDSTQDRALHEELTFQGLSSELKAGPSGSAAKVAA